MTITYENQNGRRIKGEPSYEIDVRLDGKRVGEIIGCANGYFYKPIGGRTPGHSFPTIAQVKASLESE